LLILLAVIENELGVVPNLFLATRSRDATYIFQRNALGTRHNKPA